MTGTPAALHLSPDAEARPDASPAAAETAPQADSGPAAQDLWADRQIQARDPVLVEPDSTKAEQPGNDRRHRGEEERAASLREITAEALPFIHLNGHV